jgi:hypothetical protein
MMTIFSFVWCAVFGFAGLYLYRNPRVFLKSEDPIAHVRSAKIAGAMMMVLAVVCEVVNVALVLARTSR